MYRRFGFLKIIRVIGKPEVLDLVASAMTNKQVARALYISEQTVKNHVKKILHKLHLTNRVELALHARRVASG